MIWCSMWHLIDFADVGVLRLILRSLRWFSPCRTDLPIYSPHVDND